MRKRIRTFSNSGQSLVELILVIGLAGLLLPGLFTGLISAQNSKAQQIRRLEAETLLKEAQEALRNIRESGWANVSENGTFYPSLSGSAWILTSGTETINGLSRSIEIEDVQREQDGTIASPGEWTDPSTKLVTITVSWSTPIPTSISSQTYITRYLDNLVFFETTEAEFDAGEHTGTTVVNNSGGEIVLGAGGSGDWCTPSDIFWEYDLPKNGVANALTATEGQVYAGTGDNASGESYALFSVADPTSAFLVDTLNGYKTNDVFGQQDYGFIATDTNSAELVIIRLSDMTVVGTFDTPGPTDAESVFIEGNTAFVASGSTLYSIDVTNKNSPTALDSDGVGLSGSVRNIFVRNSHAYVAVNSTSTEMQIVDISNPSNLSVVGNANVNAGGGGTDVYVNDTGERAYLVTGNSSSQDEFFIINIEDKNGSRPAISSYDTNGMSPNGVRVVPGSRAIIVGFGGEEYQVVNIFDENSLSRCGGREVDTGIYDIDAVIESDGDAYSYIVTGDSTTELKIIEGGPGGQFASDGFFDSYRFDSNFNTAFNRTNASFIEPNNTVVRFQVSVMDAVSNSCDGITYEFVGPDGTSNTFFTGEGPIPLNDDGTGYENPGRCFKYRVYLETEDSITSPVFEDITVNYSP